MTALAHRPTVLHGVIGGASLAARRLRPRGMLAMLLVTLAATSLFTLLARSGMPIDAPSRSISLVLRWVVPLTAFAITQRVVGGARLDDSVWPLASHGMSRRHLVLGVAAVAAAASAAIAVLNTAVALVLAYGTLPGLAADLLTSGWIAALGGAAYASWFILGVGLFRKGRGIWVPLIADFTLGATSGLFAIVWPRPHLANLAGGPALLDLTQPSSTVALLAMTTAIVCLAAMRAGD